MQHRAFIARKEVRSVYFVFVHTKSLLKDGHSVRLSNLNPLSIARAGPLFLHIKIGFKHCYDELQCS